MPDELEQSAAEQQKIEPIWAVVANVVEERPYGPGGKETRRGTKKFRAGQKVYLQDVFWGMGGENVTVIGRHHGKHGYITSSVYTGYLQNFRAELVYSPTIIDRIQYGYTSPDKFKLTAERIAKSGIPLDGSEESHQKAKQLSEEFNIFASRLREERLKEIKRQDST